MTTVELDSLWANQEFQQLLEAAEQSGSVRHAELAEVLEPHELGLLETDAVYRELDPTMPVPHGPHLFGCMAALLEV